MTKAEHAEFIKMVKQHAFKAWHVLCPHCGRIECISGEIKHAPTPQAIGNVLINDYCWQRYTWTNGEKTWVCYKCVKDLRKKWKREFELGKQE